MRILAATDGSRHAEAAVRFAGWLASSLRGGRLEVLLVGDVGTQLIGQGGGAASRPGSPMEEEYRSWARKALDRAAREARRSGVAARCRYVEASLAPVADVLSLAASRLHADVLVVGSAGRGAVGRALLGSVTRRLVHLARRPVIVVPSATRTRRGEGLRILSATDGSREALAAVRFAASMVRRARRGSLEVVTVGTLRRDLAVGFSSAVLSFLPFGELQSSERRAAERILRQAGAAARSRGVPAKLRFLEPRTEHPVAELLARKARLGKSHLLAVGGSGRGAVEDWAVGGVTSRLLRSTRRPLMVVPPARRPR